MDSFVNNDERSEKMLGGYFGMPLTMMKRFVACAALLMAAISLYQCQSGKSGSLDSQSAFNIRFMYFPPKDLADTAATPKQLVEFAWEEFLALNWRSSYAQNGHRDFPDTTWNYADSTSPYPDMVVWETYAHRSELRPYSNKMLPFDTAPHYSYGTPLIPYPNSGASFSLFDVLDENNEIGSCDLYARVNSYDKQYMVLYQAKVNRDEYEYILNHYPTKKALTNARLYTVSMIDSIKAYYPGVKNSCDCPDNYKGISLPCGNNESGRTGAMEVKTAWRELTPKDDPSKFFTRKVVYFRKGTKSSDTTIYYDNKTYALVGLHIIHKTSKYEDFVFATWEHVDVQKDSMGYVLLNDGNEKGPLYAAYPRLHPIPDIVNQSTDYVHSKLKAMNPKSVWLNYRLVGVQAKPTRDPTTFSFFLANYVVESDTTLADFHGSGFAHPHDTLPNTFYRGNRLSMGGCQGCHGVAQTTEGTDFSFLLDDVDKPIKKPDLRGDQSAKLQKLILATTRK